MNKHPQYNAFKNKWDLVRDFYNGTEAVKQQGTVYLPATSGHVIDGMTIGNVGYEAYQRYKARAEVPHYVSDVVRTLLGYAHQKSTQFILPASLEYLISSATPQGVGLAGLLQEINLQQLITGRLGLLLDLPSEGSPLTQPYIALYDAERIINWDSGARITDASVPSFINTNLVVLDESGYQRSNAFDWQYVNSYRILFLGDVLANELGLSEYRVATVSRVEDFNPLRAITPMLRGVACPIIPFVFINALGCDADPDVVPLEALAEQCCAIYRNDADYKHSLHMQGQDTLVIVGGMSYDDGVTRVGAGSKIDVNIGGDAKFIGVSSNGLPEQRLALENMKNSALLRAGLLLSAKEGAESGDALKVRASAQTVTLTKIVLAGAEGLKLALKNIGLWMGLPAEEIESIQVKPNLEFINDVLPGDELVKLGVARNEGVPLSYESMHTLMVKRGLTDKTYEEELALIRKEVEAYPIKKESSSGEVNNKTSPGEITIEQKLQEK